MTSVCCSTWLYDEYKSADLVTTAEYHTLENITPITFIILGIKLINVIWLLYCHGDRHVGYDDIGLITDICQHILPTVSLQYVTSHMVVIRLVHQFCFYMAVHGTISYPQQLPLLLLDFSKCFRAGYFIFSQLKFKVNKGINLWNLCFKIKTKTYLVFISVVTIHSACHC